MDKQKNNFDEINDFINGNHKSSEAVAMIEKMKSDPVALNQILQGAKALDKKVEGEKKLIGIKCILNQSQI